MSNNATYFDEDNDFFSKDFCKFMLDNGYNYLLLVEDGKPASTNKNYCYRVKQFKKLSHLEIDKADFIYLNNQLLLDGVFSEKEDISKKVMRQPANNQHHYFSLRNNRWLLCLSENKMAANELIFNSMSFSVKSHFNHWDSNEKIIELKKTIKQLNDELSQPSNEEPIEEIVNQSDILLAEDNLANQMLITQQLELLGYTVDVAENGSEALKLHSKGRYKLLLTDCNMPVMDGFELTRSIRDKEKEDGKHIPIIAVTANAMHGEADNCLQSGMDDYLSKPIKLKALQTVIERWSNTLEEAEKSSIKKQVETVLENDELVIDYTLLEDFLGNDRKMQDEFVNSFLVSTPDIISSLVTSCLAEDVEKIEFDIHKLKSSCKAIGAFKLLVVVENIELEINQGGWEKIPDLSRGLELSFREIELFVLEQKGDSSSNNIIELNEFSAPLDLRVLLLDDDPFMLDYLKIMLTKLGVTDISLADQGLNALQILENSVVDFDVVFCDLNMPGMDGVTFLRHLSELSFKGGIIINSGEDDGLLSVVAELAEAHHLKLLGALKKPILPNQVLSLFSKLEKQNKVGKINRNINANHHEDFSVDDLSKGIRDNHIIVYYQPKIDIKSKEIVGFEALARWNDPKRGIIPPYIFIPIAEEENLIGELTDKVFIQAITETQKWQSKFPGLKVSINFAMQSMSRLELPDLLSETIKQVDISANSIIIEVTESGLMENLAVSMEVLARLKLLGFSLSIDDFGTGYSSLNQLQRLPFSELKLDHSFVNGASHDAKARAILESSIELAKKLNITIVAEGVETQKDWDLIKELGCDIVQGFFIAKPMPASECFKWLENWNSNSHDNL